MLRALHYVLTLLIAAALFATPVASGEMLHGEPGAAMAAQAHCADPGAVLHADASLIPIEGPTCEVPCAVCGICGVSGLPSSVTLSVTADLSGPVPGVVAMALDARAGPDLRPPL